MAASLVRQTHRRAANAAAGVRGAVTCSASLRQLEDGIQLGLHARLASLREDGREARVAVVGRPSPAFSATLRAARSCGAATTPVDGLFRHGEDVVERLSAARAQLAVVTGVAEEAEMAAAHDAARKMAAQVASTAALCSEGQFANAPPASQATGPAPLVLLARPDGAAPRAVEVPAHVFDARVKTAVGLWGFTSNDTVLSLGLPADSPAIIDAIEAPLSVGASVALPEIQSSPREHIWDFWAAVRDTPEATVVFMDPGWAERLVSTYSEIGGQMRAELQARWRGRPLRHAVAVLLPGQAPPEDNTLTDRFAQVFGCPLTLHFSCAEVGSLYNLRGGEAPEWAEGLEWRLKDGELWVRGSGVFERYLGRPRSTEQAFALGDAFCRTGHAAQPGPDGAPRPASREVDKELRRETNTHLYHGPRLDTLGMEPDFTVRKLMIKHWHYTKTKKGYYYPTDNHTNVLRSVYRGKYK